MFDIGFAELLVCAVVALLVLGPERLPGAVRTVGRWVGRARHTVGQFTDQIDREIRAEELKRRIEEELKKSGVNDVARQVKEALHAPLPEPLIGANHLRQNTDAPVENAIAPPALAAAASASPNASLDHDNHADIAPALRERRAAGLAAEDDLLTDETDPAPADARAGTPAAAPVPVTHTAAASGAAVPAVPATATANANAQGNPPA